MLETMVSNIEVAMQNQAHSCLLYTSNTTGVCIPEKHYMVNINGRLQQIKVLVDEGKYFRCV